MRKSKIDLLLAGTVLALAVAAPAFAAAAHDRTESVVPLPPALDVQMQRHPANAPAPARDIRPADAAPQAPDDHAAGIKGRSIRCSRRAMRRSASGCARS